MYLEVSDVKKKLWRRWKLHTGFKGSIPSGKAGRYVCHSGNQWFR